MMMAIPQLLDANELATCRALMAQAQWASGALTAGTQSTQVKNNRQLPEDAPEARIARDLWHSLHLDRFLK